MRENLEFEKRRRPATICSGSGNAVFGAAQHDPTEMRQNDLSRPAFVCMGNICRSPQQKVFFVIFNKNNLGDDKVEVDSAGTHGYHVGEAPDSRHPAARGGARLQPVATPCAKVARQDLDYFDLILAMDKSNLDNLRRLATPEQQERIKLFMDYARSFDDDEVPDPYYGLGHGFDLVLDMVEDASLGLIEEIS